MTKSLRIVLKTLLAVMGVLALALAIVWPWPAPDVDWRKPLGQALARKDCARVAIIVNAAARAGVLEAYDMVATPDALGACYEASSSRMPPQEYANLVKSERKDRAIRRGSLARSTQTLDFRVGAYVQLVDFLCRQPYALEVGPDNVALSAVFPEDASWSLALHRQRRGVCVGVLENLVVSLAARAEPDARTLAFHFANSEPIDIDSPVAAVALAKLVLRQQYISRSEARGGANLVSLMRSLRWRALRQAAEANDREAIELLIALLHEGRFLEDARLRSNAQKSPYFWIVRSRRLGLPDSETYAEIEAALDAAARARIKGEEEYDWSHRGRIVQPAAAGPQ
jgi:hypothetical protein